MSFDLPILDWIQAHLQSGLMDTIWPIITMFGDAGIFWMVWATLLLFIPKYRRTGLGMWFALAMGLLICNITLKPLVGRIRPYDFQITELGKTWNDLLAGGELLVELPHDFSFPSGHTIASFEACTVLLLNSKLMGIPAVILAILIAFSRLYLYVHYPSDVIFSVFAGILFGILGNLIAKKIPLPQFGKRGKYQR
ncbi:MAG: phosphatase PAP2 family protein [Oscillospiraceae bacterium]|nr:phosphatase PAP2 family protein [Oscillospiraceae bacterium]MBQ7129730.1 phosphatase PAP2 family protein [Oscillospiraceae bacterium]